MIMGQRFEQTTEQRGANELKLEGLGVGQLDGLLVVRLAEKAIVFIVGTQGPG